MNILIIVESPGKIQKLTQIFGKLQDGNNYKVLASVGHVADLTNKGLGFDLQTFKPMYVVSPEKKSVVQKLQQAKKTVDKVILATDLDREGEAISYHLKNILSLDNPDRIKFGEITADAVAEALKNPCKIDMKKVRAQETRRLADRAIGWEVSNILRTYVLDNGSAGRVQTAVVLLVVRRELEIRNFTSLKHYGVDVYAINSDLPWTAHWDSKPFLKDGEPYLLDKNIAEDICKTKTANVIKYETKIETTQPPAPFITSTLQRTAQNVYKFKPNQTMELAQKLYETGYITYMRTDTPNISDQAFDAIKNYGAQNSLSIVSENRKFTLKGAAKATAQEAHEAIRPSNIFQKTLESLPSEYNKYFEDMKKLYALIWTRTVSSQMDLAEYSVIDIELEAPFKKEGYPETVNFKARSRKLIKAGWIDLGKNSQEEGDDESLEQEATLPNLNVGDIINFTDTQLREKNTTAPSRFNDSSLIKKLESLGIGRPSTFHTISPLLLSREYICYKKDKIHATERAEKIISELEPFFTFIDLKYTAELENKLDDVLETGEWLPVIKGLWSEVQADKKNFISEKHKKLPQHLCESCNQLLIQSKTPKGFIFWTCSNETCQHKYSDFENKPHVKLINNITEYKCLECNENLVQKIGSKDGVKYNKFLCSGSKKGRCFATYERLDDDSPNFDLYREKTKYKCKSCQKSLLERTSKESGEKFWVCSGKTKVNPSCYEIYKDKNNQPDYDQYDLDHTYNCKKCKGFLRRRPFKSKEGFYWICGNSKCSTFYDDNQNGQPDYLKHELNSKHKCVFCESFLTFGEKDDKKWWVCSNKMCNCYYNDVSTQPSLLEAKEKYQEACPNCKQGRLFVFTNPKTLQQQWACSNKACSTYLPDVDGKPDLTFKPSKTKKK